MEAQGRLVPDRLAVTTCRNDPPPRIYVRGYDDAGCSASGVVNAAEARHPDALHSLLRKSTISGWLQSTAPMNLRRTTPFRSMM